MGPAGVSAAVDLTPSISRKITYKHDTHLKKHLQVSENPHWVTTALHEWPSKVKRKIIPKKSANVALFPSRSWSISTFICLLICLLQSSNEYENEMSILSVTSFYRQFGQLNCHLIIITKKQQKDKGTQKRFFWGPTSCHAMCPRDQCQALMDLADPRVQPVLFSRIVTAWDSQPVPHSQR